MKYAVSSIVLVPWVTTTPQAELLELLWLVEGDELVRLHGHPGKLLDLRDSFDHLPSGQSGLARGGVAEILEPVGRIARDGADAGHEMNAAQRRLILLRFRARRHGHHHR
jgi:hypothetical protein